MSLRGGEVETSLRGGETPAEGIEPTVTLNDGRRMPTSIIGTFVGDDEAHTSPESCRQLVRDALAAGFRHFDTATVYGNEEELGRALRDAPDVFVTTKVAHPNNDRGEWWTLAPWVSDASLDATEGVLQAARGGVDRDDAAAATTPRRRRGSRRRRGLDAGRRSATPERASTGPSRSCCSTGPGPSETATRC